MSEDASLVHLTYPTVIGPILDKLEVNNEAAVSTLRQALVAADQKHPGFLLEFLKALVARTDVQINLQEAFLRIQADLPQSDFGTRGSGGGSGEKVYSDLSVRAFNLRKILARIPDEMSDRRQFLETIKEIASSIRKLLDATNSIIESTPTSLQPRIEHGKRDFVKYSKRFSNTLKDYFRGEDAALVFSSANQLILHTNRIVDIVQRVHEHLRAKANA